MPANPRYPPPPPNAVGPTPWMQKVKPSAVFVLPVSRNVNCEVNFVTSNGEVENAEEASPPAPLVSSRSAPLIAPLPLSVSLLVEPAKPAEKSSAAVLVEVSEYFQ